MKLLRMLIALFRKEKKDSILKWYSFPHETWLSHGIWKTGKVDKLSVKFWS
jgi:hypothetical protein